MARLPVATNPAAHITEAGGTWGIAVWMCCHTILGALLCSLASFPQILLTKPCSEPNVTSALWQAFTVHVSFFQSLGRWRRFQQTTGLKVGGNHGGCVCIFLPFPSSLTENWLEGNSLLSTSTYRLPAGYVGSFKGNHMQHVGFSMLVYG